MYIQDTMKMEIRTAQKNNKLQAKQTEILHRTSFISNHI